MPNTKDTATTLSEYKIEYVSVNDLIALLKDKKIKIGRSGSDIYNTLRYYTKIGLIPNMVRKFSVNEDSVVGHYPVSVIDTLIKIEELKKNGLDNTQIKKTLAQPNQSQNITKNVNPAVITNGVSEVNRNRFPIQNIVSAIMLLLLTLTIGVFVAGMNPKVIDQIKTAFNDYNSNFTYNLINRFSPDLAAKLWPNISQLASNDQSNETGDVLAKELTIPLDKDFQTKFQDFGTAAVFRDPYYVNLRLENYAYKNTAGKSIGPDYIVAQENGNGVFYLQAGGNMYSDGELNFDYGYFRRGITSWGTNRMYNGLDILSGNLNIPNGTIVVGGGNINLDGLTGNVRLSGDLNFVGDRKITGTGTLIIDPASNLTLQSGVTIDNNGNLVAPSLTSPSLSYSGNISINTNSSTGTSQVLITNQDATQVANLTVEGDIAVNGGKITLASGETIDAEITDTVKITSDGNVSFVLGDVSGNKKLFVYGSDGVSQVFSIDTLGNVITNGNVNISQSLTVDNGATITGNLSLAGDLLPIGIHNLGSVTKPWTTAYIGTLDLGTNSLWDGNLVGNWNLNSGNVSAINNLQVDNDVTVSSLTTGVVHTDANGLLSSVLGVSGYLPKWTASGLTTTSLVFDNGTNVGIGTTTPSSSLDVNGNITISGTGNYLRRDVNSDVLNLYAATTQATGSYIQIFGDTNATHAGEVRMTSKGTGDFVFNNAPVGLITESELVRVTDLGNVGIGVTAPTQKLDINGAIHLNSYVPANTSYSLYNNSGTLMFNGNTIAIGGSISGTPGRIGYFTNSDSIGDSVMFQSGANIGIGTTTPTSMLSVIGSTYISGNVGIGTTNPLTSLHNNGDFITKGPWVDVRAYGAIGDGVTDSAAAIRAAIAAAANASGGGTVYIPSGVYRIDSSITGGVSGVTIVGAGRGSTVIDNYSTDSAFITPEAIRGYTISNLTIKGRSGSSNGILILGNFGHIRIINVAINLFSAPGSSGIYVDHAGGGIDIYAENVRVDGGAVGFNINPVTTSNGLTLINCYANAQSNIGFSISGVLSSTLIGCSADNSGSKGYSLAGKVALISCTAESNTSYGFVFDGSGVYSCTNCITYNQVSPFNSSAAGARIKLINPITVSTPSGSSVSVSGIAALQIEGGNLDAGLSSATRTFLEATEGALALGVGYPGALTLPGTITLNDTTGGATGILKIETNALTGHRLRESSGGSLSIAAYETIFTNFTGGSEFARFDSNGRLGIGTTAPATAIEIGGSGNLRIGGLTASSGVYTDANKTLTSTPPTTGTLGYWQRNGTNLAPSNIGDYVGIGTTAPSANLDILGSLEIDSGGVNDYIYFDGGTSRYLTYNANSQVFFFSNGLSMASDIYSTNTNGYYLRVGNASATVPVHTIGNDTDTGIGWAGANILSLIAGGTNVMNITASNVGIGTTSPTGKLQILAPTLSNTGFIVKTTDDNTTNKLTEWRSSADAVLASMDATGKLFLTGLKGIYTNEVIVDASGKGDYTSLQTALNTEGSGKKYIVKEGTYSISSNTNVPNNVLIEGSGWDKTSISVGGVGYLVFATSPSNIVFKDLKLTGSAMGFQGGTSGASNVYFVNIKLETGHYPNAGSTGYKFINAIANYDGADWPGSTTEWISSEFTGGSNTSFAGRVYYSKFADGTYYGTVSCFGCSWPNGAFIAGGWTLVDSYFGGTNHSGKSLQIHANLTYNFYNVRAVNGIYASANWNGVLNTYQGDLGEISNIAGGTINSAGTRITSLAGSYTFNPQNEPNKVIASINAGTKGIVVKAASSQTASLFEWQNSSGVGLGAIDANGNLGIGTTSPGAKLEVSGGNLKMTSGNIVLNNNWLSGDGGNEGVYVDSSGQVGIGKVPTIALDVSGSIYASSLIYAPTIQAGGSASMFYATSKTLGIAADAQIAWSQNDNASLTKDSGFSRLAASMIGIGNGTIGDYSGTLIAGNVGIGTTGPLAKLHINGGTGTFATGLAFGDGDTGFYESSDDTLYVAAGGSLYNMRWTTSSTDIYNTFTSSGGATFTSSYNGGTPVLIYPTTGHVASVPLIVRGTTSQAADLQQWQNSASTSLVVINSSGNVGIGTTSPTSRLSVGATSQFQVNSTGNLVRVNDVAYSWPGSQGAANSTLQNNGSGTLGWADPTGTGTIGFWQRNGTSLAPSNIGDYVGIGTTSPIHELHVYGTGATTRNIAVDSESGEAQLNLLAAGTTKWSIVNRSGDSHAFELRGPTTTPFRINTDAAANSLYITATGVGIGTSNPGTAGLAVMNGNVGIGTTSPSSKLEVLGTSNQFRLAYNSSYYTNLAVDSTGMLTISPNGTTVAQISDSSATISVPTSFTAAGDVSMAYDLIMTNQTTSGIRSYGPMTLEAGENWESNDLTLKTYNSGQVVFDSPGGIVLGGSLLPSANDTYDLGSDTYRWRDMYLGGETLHIGTSTSDEYTVGYNTTNNYLGFNVNGSGDPEVVMNSSGYIGIGTTSPGSVTPLGWQGGADSRILEVKTGGLTGDSGLLLTRSDDLAGLYLWQDTSTGDAYFDNMRNNPVADIYFRTQTSGTPVSALSILGSGNVGIGTTSPDNALTVSGSIVNVTNTVGGLGLVSRFWGQSYIYGINLGSGDLTAVKDVAGRSGGNLSIYASAGNSLALGSNGVGSQMVINNGNVGIGTTSPGARLEVSTTNQLIANFQRVNNSTLSGYITFTDDTLPRGYLGYESDTGGAIVPGSRGNSLVLRSDSALHLVANAGPTASDGITINSSAVGIGTTSPSHKLEILGTDNYPVQIKGSSGGGFILGAYDATAGGFWSSAVTPSANNYALLARDTNTYLSAPNGSIYMLMANSYIPMLIGSTGTTIKGATITSAQASLNVTNSADTSLLYVRNDGNIGIGTTSPSSLLQVNNGGTFTLAKGVTFGNGDTGIFESADNTLDVAVSGNSKFQFYGSYFQGTGGGPLMFQATPTATVPVFMPNQSDTNTGIGWAGADILSLIAGGTNVLNVTAGNVGIGTTTPSNKLEVFGTSNQFRIAYSGSYYTNMTVDSTGMLTVAPNGTTAATFADTGNTFLLPTSFTSAGDVSMAYDLNFTNETASYIKAVAPLYIQAGESFESNNLTLQSYNSGKIIFDSPGGIELSGSILPSANDTYDLGSDTYRWRDMYLGGETLHIGTSTSDEYTLGYNTTNNYLGFNVNGSGEAEVVMNSSGYVGIGTTAPGADLQIGNGVLSIPWNYNSYNLMNIDTFTYGGVDDDRASIFSQVTANSTTNNSETVESVTSAVESESGNVYNHGAFAALVGKIYHRGTGTLATATGGDLELYNYSTGIVTAMRGVAIDLTNQSTGTITDAYWLKLNNLANTSGTVANTYGLWIGDLTVGTQTNTPYSIYSSDVNALNYFAGYVGIGTSNPATTLDVRGGISMTTSDFAAGTTGSGLGLTQGVTTGNTFARIQQYTVGGTAYGDISLNALGGNVGIGTTGPVATLEVSNLTSTGNAGIAKFAGDDGSITFNDSNSSNRFFMSVVENTLVTAYTVFGTSVVGDTVQRFGFAGDGKLQWSPGSGAFDTNLYRTSAGVLQTDSSLNVAGNVGIGTTSPSAKLEVAGDIGLGNGNKLYLHSGADTNWYLQGNDGSNNVVLNGYSSGTRGFEIRDTASSDAVRTHFDFGTGNSYINAGNVGIGTTSPGGILHLRAASDANIKFTDEGSNIMRMSWIDDSASTINAEFYAYRQRFYVNGTNRMTLSESGGLSIGSAYVGTDAGVGNMIISGNVGIGTTSPTQKLHISGGMATIVRGNTGQTTFLTLQNTSGALNDTADLDYAITPGAAIMGRIGLLRTNRAVAGDSDFTFSTYSSSSLGERMRITDTGNVGIGITNPSARLDIASTTNTNLLNLSSSVVTTTNGANITLNGLTSGKGLNLTSTSSITSGQLAYFDWSPTSLTTASSDLFTINIGANGTTSAAIFNVTDNGNSIFKVTETQIVSNVPHAFTAAGDVDISNDLVFSNTGGANIKSNGPLTITSGDSYDNHDLVLKGSGTGGVVVGSGFDLKMYTGRSLVFDIDDSANTYITHDASGDRLRYYVDGSEMFRMDTAGNESNGSIATALSDVAENYPTMDESLSAGDVVALVKTDDSNSNSHPELISGSNTDGILKQVQNDGSGGVLNDVSSYLVEKVAATNIDQVIGIVSSKPGVILGGGSFQSEFCQLVNSSAIGEAQAKEQLLAKELQQKVDSSASPLNDEEGESASVILSETKDPGIDALGMDSSVVTLPQNDDSGGSSIDTATLNAINDRVTSCKALKQVPIALSGRVPVKVDTTAGEIKAGDLLAPSSIILGKAVKATSAGWVIGRALESSSSEKDTVMTLVFMSWWPGTSDLAQNSPVVGDVKGDMVLTSEIADVKITKSLMSLGKTQLADTTIAGDLTINGDIANVFGDITFQGKKIAMTTDGSIKVAESVTAKKYNVDTGDVASASAGVATIKAGDNEVKVTTSSLTSRSLIFLTPKGVPVQVAYTVNSDNTFTIIMAQPSTQDILINWWIVN